MSENENETKNYKKPLFNHPRENYQIFEEVITWILHESEAFIKRNLRVMS